MSDLKRLQISTFAEKRSVGNRISMRYMLRYLEEMFYPVPTKTINCYGEYQKEFDELPPSVELAEGFPDSLNDMVLGHDHSLVVLDDLIESLSKRRFCQHGRHVGPEKDWVEYGRFDKFSTLSTYKRK